jgi:HlyD family secretion protein
MNSHIDAQTRIERKTSGAISTTGRGRGRRAWVIAAVAGVLLVAAIGTWWRISTTAPTQYVTAPVSRGAITQAVTATGTVNPVLTIIVGAQDSGVIQQLYCDYNAQVKIGEVCAKIDPRPFQATLDQYSGQLLRDEALLNEARLDLARYQKLAAQNSIARQQAEDQAYVVQQYEGTVKLDQSLVEGAKLNLEYTNIISPVDGIVVSRNVTQGQTVASSFQTPTLFLIATDLKKMEVDTNVSESDIGGMKEGDKATFTVDAYPNRTFQGTVAQARQSPQTVQNVVTYDIVVGVDNTDLALKPGMTASMQIITAQRNDVLRVPDQALRYVPGGLSAAGPGAPASGQARVWVLRDGRTVAIPVVLGLDDGTFTEIVKGDLQPGDQVITAESRGQTGPSGLPAPRL